MKSVMNSGGLSGDVQVPLFQWTDSQSREASLTDAVCLEKGTWFRWERIQLSDSSVGALKEHYGERFSLFLNFTGKLLIKAGVSCAGKSFVWCGEAILASHCISRGACAIDLRNVTSGILEITLYAIEESAVFGDFPPLAKEKTIASERILYAFVFPSYELCCEEPLYCRFSGKHAWYSFTEQCIHLKNGAAADLTTYFNAFSASKWKKYTNVEDISLYVDFSGKARAELIHLDEKGQAVLAAWRLDSLRRATLELPAGEYPDTGILGLRISAKADCLLYGGGWLSDASDTHAVHLGIGITTFHREETVKTAVARLGKAIEEHPLYNGAIDITVVDNGQTLNPEDVQGAMLLPNRNLGGAGGFMRSLIHYQETGRHTHCLFMDDDASCEPGSIFRSMAFMRHAKDEKTAICGGMLYKNIQFLQWESGAWFDGGCHSVNRDLDLRDADNLLVNEKECSEKIYGAWWFFFFPLAEAKHCTLPFFVRGDDIDFSYANNFIIVTLNGVSCWQQDFKSKENALTVYLFMRSHVMHHLTIPRLQGSFRTVWNVLWRHFSGYNNSYFYACAASVNLALQHVLQGPSFWEKNMDPDAFLKQIKIQSVCEQVVPYTEKEAEELVLAEKNVKTSFLPVFFRKLSLNGHLFPKWMIRHTPKDMLYKQMTPNRNRVYMRDQVIVLDEVTKSKTVLRRNPKLFLKNLFLFFTYSFCFFIRYKYLILEYSERALSQRTKEFWKKEFNI